METLELIELVDYSNEISPLALGSATGGCCFLCNGGCAGNDNDSSKNSNNAA